MSSTRHRSPASGELRQKAGARMSGKGEKSIGRLLMIAARMHRARVGEKLQSLGLFPGQEHVLEALATQGQMPMGELARVLNVRPPTVSKTIQRLSVQGLVERTAEGGDGRLVHVRLTDAGIVRASQLTTLMGDVETELASELDGKDRKRMRKLLRRATRALANASGRASVDTEADLEIDEPDDER